MHSIFNRSFHKSDEDKNKDDCKRRTSDFAFGRNEHLNLPTSFNNTSTSPKNKNSRRDKFTSVQTASFASPRTSSGGQTRRSVEQQERAI